MVQSLIGQIYWKIARIYIIHVLLTFFFIKNHQTRIRNFKRIVFILTDILLPGLMKEGEWVLL